jgi:protein JSN1
LSSTNNGGNGFSVLDELRSVTSADSADDFDVHTLDYLGLDDGHRPPPAATISELRNQAQAAIAGNLANPSARLRASTVSNPYRLRPSVAGSHLSTPTADEDEEYFDNYEEQTSTYSRQRLNSYDTSTVEGPYLSAYVAKGFKQTDHLSAPNGLGSRPRAISVGNLDDPIRALQRRAAVTEVQQHSYINELSPHNSGLGMTASSIGGPSGILKNDKLTGGRLGGSSPTVHFPNGDLTANRISYLITPGSQSQTRAISPKSDSPSSQTQAPTRSLWIGNLDSAVTSEQLIHVFAPYGAIESLRLLPEKVRPSCSLNTV